MAAPSPVITAQSLRKARLSGMAAAKQVQQAQQAVKRLEWLMKKPYQLDWIEAEHE
jgi:hypothetical protein